MIELNQIHTSNKIKEPIYYRAIRVFLMLLSAILMFSYLTGVMSYITSGPSTTLLDDLTTDYVVTIVLLGLALFSLIIAWFRNVSYGIVSLVFLMMYVIYVSFISSPLDFQLMIDFLAIAISVNAVGFIIIGIIKRHSKNREFDINAQGLVDGYEGPDVFNFRI